MPVTIAYKVSFVEDGKHVLGVYRGKTKVAEIVTYWAGVGGKREILVHSFVDDERSKDGIPFKSVPKAKKACEQFLALPGSCWLDYLND